MDTTFIMIGICDDHAHVHDELKAILRKIHHETCDRWRVVSFINASDLMKRVNELNILFLDIDMPEMDGIEAGKHVAKLNPECRVIMATGEIHRYKEAFIINAIRFVTKPFNFDEVKEAMDAALAYLTGLQIVTVFRERTPFHIRQKDIQYIRAFNGYIEIYTQSGNFRKDISMKEMEKELDSRLFARIHKTYIIGLAWVKSYTKDQVTLNNISLPIARRQYSEFQSRHVTYSLDIRG